MILVYRGEFERLSYLSAVTQLREWQGWASAILQPNSRPPLTSILSCPGTKLLDCQSWAHIASLWEVYMSPFRLAVASHA